jgi:hypothetical protein
MSKSLLVGGGVVAAGVFVGLVTYKIAQKKGPAMIERTRERASNIGKKATALAAEAKRAFMGGSESTRTKAATAL